MRVDRLRIIQSHILEEPARADIWRWKDRLSAEEDGPPCRTVGCIAGWATVLFPEVQVSPMLDTADKAAEILELSWMEKWDLFFATRWPLKFKMRIADTMPQTPEHAECIAERIDDFIRNMT